MEMRLPHVGGDWRAFRKAAAVGSIDALDRHEWSGRPLGDDRLVGAAVR